MNKFIRRNGFWFLMIVLFFGAQFFVKRDLVTGNPPPIHALTVAGELFDLNSLKGQPAVIYFWASWCGICGAMDGMIDELSEDYPMMTVAMQSGGNGDVLAHLKKKGLGFPVIADNSGEISRRYGIQAVPAVFILSPSGEIKFSTMGFATRWGIEVRLWLAGQGLL